MKNSENEEVADNEFYMVTYEDHFGIIKTVNVHINNETIFDYMLRVYEISNEFVHCIYKRIYVK